MATGYFAWDLRDRGGAPALRDDAVELSYVDFADRVDALAAQLAERGVTAGDVVAVCLPNRVELVATLQAAWRLGAAATPLNPAFTEPEARRQVADAGASVVVTDRDDVDFGAAVLPVDEIETVPRADWTPPEPGGDDDVALLIYTSGSTGTPKGVELLHRNLRYMSAAMCENSGATAEDHCMLILPLFHVNAICVSVLAPLVAGSQITIVGRFSASRFFEDVARLRPTYFSAVPAIYALLVSRAVGKPDTSSLRYAVCGAAPASKELLTAAEELLGAPIIEGYGLTESTCSATCNPLDGPRKLGSVGIPMPGTRIVIMSPEGDELPTGERGEVCVVAPSVMHGYRGRPEETASTVVDGRLHTGDVGYLDEDGYLFLVDRIKDMIIRGGENLYPKEIENALTSHDDVLEAAVVGRPDPLFGEVPVAYVSVYPERRLDAETLTEHLRTRLAKEKIPVSIEVCEELPRNPVGKIDKPALRRNVAAGL